MTVYELGRAQLAELKAELLDQRCMAAFGRCASYGELAGADAIPDADVYEAYADVEFISDDFWEGAEDD